MNANYMDEVRKQLESPKTPFQKIVHGSVYTLDNKVFERRRDAMLLLHKKHPGLARFFVHRDVVVDRCLNTVYISSTIAPFGGSSTSSSLLSVYFFEDCYKIYYDINSCCHESTKKSYNEEMCAEDIVSTIVEKFNISLDLDKM